MSVLIMSDNRPQQIVDGDKTLTSRLVMPGDRFREGDKAFALPDAVISGKDVVKWKVGGVYGIKRQRIAPVCLVDKYDEVVMDLRRTWERRFRVESFWTEATMRDDLLYKNEGYSLLQVKVLALRHYDVRDITCGEAHDEGFNRRSEFWQTWCGLYDAGAIDLAAFMQDSDFIHIHLKSRPAHLYTAWQIRFERVLP